VKSLLAIASTILIGTCLIGSAYAHKSQVIGNYNFEVGWDKEPPVAGKPNTVIVTVSKMDSMNKTPSKQGNQKHADGLEPKGKHGITKSTKSDQKTERKTMSGISGLSKILQVDVSVNGKKTILNIVEDKNNPGRYLGAYTPEADGYPIVHLYAKLDSKDMEITFHPEKIMAK